MADIRIPVTAPTKRKDGSDLPLSQLARFDFELSSDNGGTFTHVGSVAPDATEFALQGLDTGTYLVRATATDTQDPPLVSDFSSVVSFQVRPPVLAAPNPPSLGTPIVT